MKATKASELQVGDIFAKEIKLIGREAFQVIDPKPGKNYMIVKSRTTYEQKKLMIQPDENVYFLRHEEISKINC